MFDVMGDVQCSMFDIRCPMFDVRRYGRYSMFDIRYSMLDARRYLVLSLPGHVRPREDHPGVLLPERVGVHLVLDPRLEGLGELEHEVRPRSDAVRVKPEK